MHITVFISDIFNTHCQHVCPCFVFLVCVISSSRGSSLPRDQTHASRVPCTGRQLLHHWRRPGSPYLRTICPSLEAPTYQLGFGDCSTLWQHVAATYCHICLNGLPHILARHTFYSWSFIFILIWEPFPTMFLVSKRRKEFWFCLLL